MLFLITLEIMFLFLCLFLCLFGCFCFYVQNAADRLIWYVFQFLSFYFGEIGRQARTPNKSETFFWKGT